MFAVPHRDAGALSEPEDDKKFWKLVELLPKDGPHVLVEGDILLSTDELRRYLVAASVQ